MQSTIVYTYGLIFDPIGECHVPFNPSQMIHKVVPWYLMTHSIPSKCITGLIKLARDGAYISALLRLNWNIQVSLLHYQKHFDFLGQPIFWKVLKWPCNRQKLTYFKNDQNRSWDMSQGPLCPNLTQKVHKEVSQMVNHNLPCVML